MANGVWQIANDKLHMEKIDDKNSGSSAGMTFLDYLFKDKFLIPGCAGRIRTSTPGSKVPCATITQPRINDSYSITHDLLISRPNL